MARLLTPLQPGGAFAHLPLDPPLEPFGGEWVAASGKALADQNGFREMRQAAARMHHLLPPGVMGPCFSVETLDTMVRDLFHEAKPEGVSLGWWTGSRTGNPETDLSVTWSIDDETAAAPDFVERLVKLAARLRQDQVLAMDQGGGILVPRTLLSEMLRPRGSILAPDPDVEPQPALDSMTSSSDETLRRLKAVGERGPEGMQVDAVRLPFQITVRACADGDSSFPLSWLQNLVFARLEELGIDRPSCSLLHALDGAHVTLESVEAVCYTSADVARGIDRLLKTGLGPNGWVRDLAADSPHGVSAIRVLRPADDRLVIEMDVTPPRG